MSVGNSKYGMDKEREMALNKNLNMTDTGSEKKRKKPETPTPPVPPVVDRGFVDDSKYVKSLQDQIADLQLRLQNGGGNSGTPKTPAYQSTAIPSYSPNADRGNLDVALASKPKDFDYDQYGRILGMMQEYQGREPFSYDLNADMLYQQYKNQYMQNGQRAMQDTVGQVSALNGGYASSYAQTAGQQAYNNELGKLNDVIPELYQLAYNRYAREGDEMLKGIELANDAYKTRYDEYRDAMTDWRNDVARAQSMYEDQRDFDYRVYADDIARAQKQQAIDLDNYQTALSMAQQNAGNKTTLDATMRALVDRGVIDEATAQNLSGVYSNVTPAESVAEPIKLSRKEYDEIATEIKENHVGSLDDLNAYLKRGEAQGWFDADTAQDLFEQFYWWTPEGKEEKMANEGQLAAWRFLK